MQQTQLVRSFINVFIVVAIGVSLFQQLINNNRPNPNAPPPSVTTSTGQQVPLQMTGPKLQGIVIKTSDKLHTPLKQILARNQYNIQMTSYDFEGNQYYLNMLFNWGHIVLIYVLIGKYKAQANEATKKKIMIGGAIAVMAWFYFSATLKPQRFAIQIQGNKVYDREYVNQKQIVDILSQYDFQMDDLNQAQQSTINPNTNIPKEDAWSQKTQQKTRQPEPVQNEYAQDQF